MAPPTKANPPAQLCLDFTSRRNEMLARIRSLPQALAQTMPQQAAEQIVEVLTRIVLFGDANGKSNARLASLAAGFTDRRKVGERTIRRWAALAKDAGVLQVIERSHENGGAQTNAWAIRWDQLSMIAQARMPSSVAQRPHAEDCEGVPSPPQKAADTGRQSGGQDVRSRADKMSAPRYSTVTSPNSIPHPPSALANNGNSQAWTGVGVDLEKLGMTLWQRFIRQAIALGISPTEVAQWITEYRSVSHFRGPGALLFRLREGAWPGQQKVPTAAELAAKATQRSQIAAEKQQDAMHQQQALDASRANQAALESHYGPLLDRLPKPETRALCETVFASNKFMLTRSQRVPGCGLVREQLLRYLHKEDQHATANS